MLRVHPELEAQLVATPDDDGAWLVYEDWLIEQGDPRSELIICERTETADAGRALATLEPLLFGPEHKAFRAALANPMWRRAGFIEACRFESTRPGAREPLVAFLSSPAATLVTRLNLQNADAAMIGELHRARALRWLCVGTTRTLDTFDSASLDGLDHLDELRVSSIGKLAAAPALARLRVLYIGGHGDAELDQLASLGLARLERLELSLGIGELHGRGTTRGFPALCHLHVNVLAGGGERAVAAVIASGIVAQLRRLTVSGPTARALSDVERRRFRGGVLAHLEEVHLPNGMLVKQ
ncbi:MAG TPA: TIGR02996 domain-containing protein [Kofleriaceae bacterium]